MANRVLRRYWLDPLTRKGKQSIFIPKGAELLSVQCEESDIYIHAIVDLDAEKKDKYFFQIYQVSYPNTYERLRHDETYKFLGTATEYHLSSSGNMIWHVFYKKVE